MSLFESPACVYFAENFIDGTLTSKGKLFTKNWLRSYLYIVVGTLLAGKGIYEGEERSVHSSCPPDSFSYL